MKKHHFCANVVATGGENDCTHGTSTSQMTTNSLAPIDDFSELELEFQGAEWGSYLTLFKQLESLNSCPFWLRLGSSSLVRSSEQSNATKAHCHHPRLQKKYKIVLKQRVNQIILLEIYMHAGRHKHLQQREQGGLYSPREWVSVSFVAEMWTGQTNAEGNEQRRVGRANAQETPPHHIC